MISLVPQDPFRHHSPSASLSPKTKNSMSKKPMTKKSLFFSGLIAMAMMQPISAQTLAQPPVTSLEERAAYYIEFRNDMMVIDATPLSSADATRDAHQRLASHDPDMLVSGWMAYAALVAADTPEFAQSLQTEFKEAKRKKRKRKGEQVLSKRDTFVAQLRQDPQSARNIAGAEAAINSVLDMMASDATKIKEVGDRFIAEAYSMQNKGWAKRKIPQDGTQRVSDAESFAYSRGRSSTPILPASTSEGVISPGLASTDAAWSPNWSTTSTGVARSYKADPVLNKILVLAARYAVGEVSEPIVNGYAKSKNSSRCVNTAKLNFAQCIAATRTPYEEAFCIGEHGLNEVSGCLGWVAGAGHSG